jgi:glycosyltransferase involved in cell wall biosynthesis
MPSQLVSILIPCYNAEQWIGETLNSVLAQTWTNKEVMVVDDGSTDNSLANARGFESANVKIISQENRGASAARNRALQEAQGDFIQYLDADDLISQDKLERQIRLLSLEENADCVSSAEWARFYSNYRLANFTPEPVWKDMSPIDWLVCSWEGGGMMPLHAWLIPRAIAQAAGNWNESLSLNDDGEYFCRVLLASQGIKFCSGAKSYYRSSISGSLSNTTSKKRWESAFRSTDLCAEYLLFRENSPLTRHACATAFQRFIFTVYPDVPDLLYKAEARVKFLGGSDLKPDGSHLFQLITNTLGWQLAKQVQKLVHSILLSTNVNL